MRIWGLLVPVVLSCGGGSSSRRLRRWPLTRRKCGLPAQRSLGLRSSDTSPAGTLRRITPGPSTTTSATSSGCTSRMDEFTSTHRSSTCASPQSPRFLVMLQGSIPACGTPSTSASVCSPASGKRERPAWSGTIALKEPSARAAEIPARASRLVYSGRPAPRPGRFASGISNARAALVSLGHRRRTLSQSQRVRPAIRTMSAPIPTCASSWRRTARVATAARTESSASLATCGWTGNA